MSDLKRYAIVQDDGRVWSVTQWDGVTPWEPPLGTAIECGEEISRDYVYQDGAFVYSPPPPPVPQSISMFQMREILRQRYLLDNVEAYIADTSHPPMPLAWEYATEVTRSGALCEALKAAISYDDAEMDALFIDAATIMV